MEPEGTAARTWAVQLCRSAGFEPDVRFETDGSDRPHPPDPFGERGRPPPRPRLGGGCAVRRAHGASGDTAPHHLHVVAPVIRRPPGQSSPAARRSPAQHGAIPIRPRLGS